eukprot:TRINITY_DN21648_c0_g1_i1.p1 TRINITY_DN21648_c0_g1~~TRINITY_DN21648_c0_g1_i1.p1  ORF type:complete len:451 (+),score=106.56 TRINITY_DN21648_c0_g1_i1:49-1353(+)
MTDVSSTTTTSSDSSTTTSSSSSGSSAAAGGAFNSAVFNSLQTIKRDTVIHSKGTLKVPVKKAARRPTVPTPNTTTTAPTADSEQLQLLVRKEDVHDVKMELFRLEEERRESQSEDSNKIVLMVPSKEAATFRMELQRLQDVQKRRKLSQDQSSQSQQQQQVSSVPPKLATTHKPISVDPPLGIEIWNWLRPVTSFQYFSNSDNDPRLVQQYTHPKPVPHITMLESWYVRKLVCHSSLILVAGKVCARVCAGRWFQRKRAAWVGGVAAAVTVLIAAEVTPPESMLLEEQELQQQSQEQQQQHSEPERTVEEDQQVPNLTQQTVDAVSQPNQTISEPQPAEYWLGLRRIPGHLTKETIRTLFNAPHRMVIDVFFWPPQQTGYYAAVQFSSPESVYECIENLWVVDGVSVLEVVDCCGGLFKRFETQDVFSKQHYF